jgi:hypothetical protein
VYPEEIIFPSQHSAKSILAQNGGSILISGLS